MSSAREATLLGPLVLETSPEGGQQPLSPLVWAGAGRVRLGVGVGLPGWPVLWHSYTEQGDPLWGALALRIRG